MGIVRNVIKGIGGFFFITFLPTTILILGLAQFTQHDNLKPIVTDIMYKQLMKGMNETQLSQLKVYVDLYCKIANETVKMNFTVTEIEVNCSEIINKQPEQIIETFTSKAFDIIYYKQYACEFIDCLMNASKGKEYLVVISEKSNIFFKEIFLYSLFATVFSIFIFLLASKDWYSRTRDLGITLISVGLPYFILEIFIYDLLQKFLPSETVELVGKNVAIFLGYFHQNFLIVLISGIVFLSIAFLIRVKSKKL